MAKPERRDPEKERFWRKTIVDYHASGLGQAEFCRQRGINVNSLNAWARIIRARDAENVALQKKANKQKRNGEHYWFRILDDWQQSGLPLNDFARRKKINYRTLLRWKQKLLPELTGAPTQAKEAPLARENVNDFVPVQIIDEQRSPKSNFQSTEKTVAIEIVMRSGHVIRIPQDCRPELLSSLLAAIEDNS
jgi:hypothetical protein